MAGSSDKPPDASSTTARSVAVNIKETLESIVVAFVLAFIFRAFIVEAFVIPTGSMAVTLYGAQLTNTCSTCGYEYACGVSLPTSDEPAEQMPYHSVRLRCPNCNMERDEFKASDIARPDSGDRILVFKWPFDVGGDLLGPKRWDVTVFKDPRDGTTNFIKRLIGLPGEVLEIIDGDVYAAPLKTLQAREPGLVEQMDQLRLEVSRVRRGGATMEPAEIRSRYLELNRRLLPYLEIQRKTDRAQQSLWSIVYNHDFLPNYGLRDDQLRSRVGWRPDDDDARAAWDTSTRRITFKSDDDRVSYIRFDGKPIDDSCVYNGGGAGRRGPGYGHPVGDLRLHFSWLPRSGSGGITLEMNRNRDRFIATLNVDGLVELLADPAEAGPLNQPQTIRRKQLKPFGPGRATRVEFINVDYQVRLMVNGQVVLTSTDDYKPRVADLERYVELAVGEHGTESLFKPSEVRIGAHNLDCELLHVALERDVYYRSQRLGNEPNRPRNPYDGWPGWGTAGQPILLRPGHVKDGEYYYGEYFMLGDNSPASKDSRLWWEIGDHLEPLGDEYQLGTVPADQLIGKAFFVYWPAGYRPSWAGSVGFIPNFGQMRWIR